MDFAAPVPLAGILRAIHFESAERIYGKEFEMSDVRIRINGQERGLREADTQWVNQAMGLTSRHADGACVVVHVRANDVSLRFAACACAGGGGFRAPNAHEDEICEIWKRCRVGDRAPSPTALCDFLNALRRHFGLRAA
jgi:hypothetical protein